jgi:hypothetical protein
MNASANLQVYAWDHRKRVYDLRHKLNIQPRLLILFLSNLLTVDH